MQERRAHDRGVRFAVRVGIHTGLVVVRALGRGDTRAPLALGQTLTMAAQVQGLAPPDTVVISPATLRLVEGYVVAQALGTYLPGRCQPSPWWSPRCSRQQCRPESVCRHGHQGLTPLVGREQEVGLLRERWAQARDGLGQVVVLSGEAGIGKSRLVQVLTEHLAGDVHTRIECHCSPYCAAECLLSRDRAAPAPVTVAPGDGTAGEAAHAGSGPGAVWLCPGGGGARYWPRCWRCPCPRTMPPLTLEPQRQKQQTLAAIVAWWLKEAERQPVCLIMEDLHWVDPSTLELLSLLLDQVPTAPMLVLLLGRPEFHPPWPPRSYLLHLALNRLARPQVETMVARLTGGKALPAEVHRQLVATTDGVPLFVEELTRMVLESGLVTEREGHYALTGPLSSLAIPATLHDSLMARLDRLSEGKRVAQLGAVIGRQFAYGLLRAVAPWEEATLQQGLGQLVDAELLYPRGSPPDGDLPVQTRADPGGGVSVPAQAHPATVPPAHCQALVAQFPETRRDAARTAGASLHGGRPQARRRFPTGSGPVSEPSSVRPMWKRSHTSPRG